MSSSPDDIDFADLFNYSPRLWADLVAAVDPGDPASLARFYDEAVKIVECTTDTEHRIPPIPGLTLGRLVDLVEGAWAAELAAEDALTQKQWTGELRTHQALSPAMRHAIVGLYLRGAPRDHIAAMLNSFAPPDRIVTPAWVDHAISRARLKDRDFAVVRGHLAGLRLPEVSRTTGTPPTTVERIVKKHLGEQVRTNSRGETATRRVQVRRLRSQGRSLKEIAELLGLPLHTVRNDLANRSTSRGPADPFRGGDTFPKKQRRTSDEAQ